MEDLSGTVWLSLNEAFMSYIDIDLFYCSIYCISFSLIFWLFKCFGGMGFILKSYDTLRKSDFLIIFDSVSSREAFIAELSRCISERSCFENELKHYCQSANLTLPVVYQYLRFIWLLNWIGDMHLYNFWLTEGSQNGIVLFLTCSMFNYRGKLSERSIRLKPNPFPSVLIENFRWKNYFKFLSSQFILKPQFVCLKWVIS